VVGVFLPGAVYEVIDGSRSHHDDTGVVGPYVAVVGRAYHRFDLRGGKRVGV
jgi:hypothetical protein